MAIVPHWQKTFIFIPTRVSRTVRDHHHHAPLTLHGHLRNDSPTVILRPPPHRLCFTTFLHLLGKDYNNFRWWCERKYLSARGYGGLITILQPVIDFQHPQKRHGDLRQVSHVVRTPLVVPPERERERERERVKQMQTALVF